MGDYLDLLVLNETKLSDCYCDAVFQWEGYKLYRTDRNEYGGVIVNVKSKIASKQLTSHNFTKNIEGLFIELNLRKRKMLVFGTYHSTHEVYGCSDVEFFEQVSLALDVYSGYENVVLAGDFNMEENQTHFVDFLNDHSLKCLIKEPTCFKNAENPSCIDLFEQIIRDVFKIQLQYQQVFQIFTNRV